MTDHQPAQGEPSETPRTNFFVTAMAQRHCNKGLDDFQHYFEGSGELASFARQLERELSAVTAGRDALKTTHPRFAKVHDVNKFYPSDLTDLTQERLVPILSAEDRAQIEEELRRLEKSIATPDGVSVGPKTIALVEHHILVCKLFLEAGK